MASTARLLEAAQALHRKEMALTEVDEVLDAALAQPAGGEAIEEAEAAASELERYAGLEDGRGLAAAAQAGAGEPWPPADGAHELLALAAERLKAAADLVAAARGAEEDGKLAAERDRLTSVLHALSTRLDSRR